MGGAGGLEEGLGFRDQLGFVGGEIGFLTGVVLEIITVRSSR